MSEVVLEGKILAWGNSYGIRIRKADLERSGLGPGDTVAVRIEGAGDRVDLSDLPTFAGGRSDVSRRHDQVLADALADEVEAGQTRGDEAADATEAGGAGEDETDDGEDGQGGNPTAGA